jgi:hypothetical protein
MGYRKLINMTNEHIKTLEQMVAEMDRNPLSEKEKEALPALLAEIQALALMLLDAEQIDFAVGYGIGRGVKNGKWKIGDLNTGETCPGEFDTALEAFQVIKEKTK